jgi:hypothetical protein
MGAYVKNAFIHTSDLKAESGDSKQPRKIIFHSRVTEGQLR